MMIRELKVRISHRVAISTFEPLNIKTGEVVELPVDCFSYCPALVNPCGFPMNDIYAYEHAASDSVADAVLHRINMQPANDVNKDISLSDKLDMVVPRNWCSPAEYSRYMEKITTKYYNRVQELKSQQQVKNDSISFDGNDSVTKD